MSNSKQALRRVRVALVQKDGPFASSAKTSGRGHLSNTS